MFTELGAGFGRLARKNYWRAVNLFSVILERRTILVLFKKISVSDTSDNYQIEEFCSNAGDIVDVYKTVSRYNRYAGSDDGTRIAARLHHGMKFYAAYENSKVVAYLWLHSSSHRFFDEAGIFVKHGQNDLWLRDVYVVPEKRGQRIFSHFVNSIIQRYYRNAVKLYSDVMRDNGSSLKAHKYDGYTVVGEVRIKRILGIFLIRTVKTGGQEVYGYKASRKCLLMGREFSSYVESNKC